MRTNPGCFVMDILSSLQSRFFGSRLPKKDVVLETHGLRIKVRNPQISAIGRSIYATGLWEPEATQEAVSAIKPGMTAVDVGADIGYFTLLFAKLVGSTGKVLSFEPIPAAKDYLDHNVQMNGLNTVSTFPVALFDRTGKSLLEDPLRTSRMNPTKNEASANDIAVDMVIFDDFRSACNIDHVDFVKIDVEGAEQNVLKGMLRTLENDHPILLIEIHPAALAGFGFSPNDLLALLSHYDYQIRPVDATSLDFSRNVTVLCSRSAVSG